MSEPQRTCKPGQSMFFWVRKWKIEKEQGRTKLECEIYTRHKHMVMKWRPRRDGWGCGMWKQISPIGGFILRSLRIRCHPREYPVMSAPSLESDYRCWSSSQSCSLRLSCVWCSHLYSFRVPAANQVLPSFRKHHSGNSRSWLFHRKAFQTKPAEGKQM